MNEEDLQNLKTDVEVMKVDTRYIKEKIDELRAEFRILSDSMVSVGEVSRLCREHEDRGKEYSRFKDMVNRHETYFLLGGTVILFILGCLWELVIKIWP